MMRTTALVTALLVASFGLAFADVSKKVQTSFRGQILITAKPLPNSGADDAETIKLFKKAQAKSLVGVQATEDSKEWSFHFTAFMTKAPQVDKLSMDFYTNDKEKLYVANKRLMGITKGVPILSGQISITEDDGLVAGKSYLVKLTGQVRGREVTFAKTTVTMK